MVPIIIGFLASVIGLGGIGQKIREIIEKLQKPVNKALDFVIKTGLKLAGPIIRGIKGISGKVKAKVAAGKAWVKGKVSAPGGVVSAAALPNTDPGGPSRPCSASVARYAATTPRMISGPTARPAEAVSAVAMTIADSGSFSTATIMTPMPTAMPAVGRGPGGGRRRSRRQHRGRSQGTLARRGSRPATRPMPDPCRR